MPVESKNDYSSFPVFWFKDFLIKSILKYNVLFVSAHTGSGKTTIIPQILYNYGLFDKIIISQTKRLAAISSSKFVSKFFKSKFGSKVGYSVRFDEFCSKKTSINFVTDGILFKKIASISFSSENSCLIIDEFHERTIFTDLILVLIKKILVSGRIKKLIIMSATGNSGSVAKYFGKNVGKIIIPGKIYDIKTYFLKLPQSNYIFSIIVTILKIINSKQNLGDILVFLPGIDEIDKLHSRMTHFLKGQNYEICKLYSSLPLDQQKKTIKKSDENIQKIILSTNIAESSVTIPEIVYVLDCGLSKQKIVTKKNGTEILKIYPISKSEIQQRTGRAGRTKNGKCFRFFTFSDYKRLYRFPRPEIQKIELNDIILVICGMSSKNLYEMDIISLPSKWGVIRSLENLYIIGAIDKNLVITFFGKCMSIYPIDIKFSKSILEAIRTGERKLITWIITTSACFSTNSHLNLRTFAKFSPKNRENMGDFFFLGHILYKFQIINDKKWSQNFINSFFQNMNFFENALKIKKQLINLSEYLINCLKKNISNNFSGLPMIVMFKVCFVSGFFLNAARIIKNKEKSQTIISGILCKIHPQSLCSSLSPNAFIYNEIVVSSNLYVKGILPIRLIWLIFFGNKIYK